MSISTACVLPGYGLVGLPGWVLVNRGWPEARSFRERMRLDFPERVSPIPDTIYESDTHYTKVQEIAHYHHSLVTAPGDLIPADCQTRPFYLHIVNNNGCYFQYAKSFGS